MIKAREKEIKIIIYIQGVIMKDTNKQQEAYVRTYMTLRQFIDKHGFMTLAAIRQLIHHNRDFREKCVRNLGKKLLINERSVLEYIEKSIPK